MNQLSNHSLTMIKHPLYHQKSAPWFDLRVFYLTISNIVVDDAIPEKLRLTHTLLDPDTVLEVNGGGRRSSSQSKCFTTQLRRHRADKKLEEATFVNTDSVKMTGSVRFEVYDADELMLSGMLEPSDDHGFTGESKVQGKRWKMICQSHISKQRQQHVCSEMILPTIEVYAAGCFSGNPIILTKTLQFGLYKKIDRKINLESKWEDESFHLINNNDEPPQFSKLNEAGTSEQLQNTDDHGKKNSYVETSDHMEDEDGELVWFNAGVRVGVGIGLGICVGVGLLVRTYHATSKKL